MKSNILVSIVLLVIFVIVFMRGAELALRYNGKKGVCLYIVLLKCYN